MTRSRTTTTALAALLAVGLAACSSMDSAGDVATGGADAEESFDGDVAFDTDSDDAGAAEPMAPEDVARAADDVVTSGGGAALAGRQLARTASVQLEVEDVEQAAAQVEAAAQRAGGFVSDKQVSGGDFGYGVLTLRVPAEAMDSTIEDLGDVGIRVIESRIATEDLTEQLTDLGARIANLEALERELQALLTDVRGSDPSATELLQVFERINQTRGEIERLKAQQAGARDRVALATIHVELQPTATAPEEVEPEPESTLGQAWQATEDAFTAIGDALIWFVVTILPVTLVLLGLPALVLWLLARTIRTRRDQRLHATPAPPSPEPRSTPEPTPTEPRPTETDDPSAE